MHSLCFHITIEYLSSRSTNKKIVPPSAQSYPPRARLTLPGFQILRGPRKLKRSPALTGEISFCENHSLLKKVTYFREAKIRSGIRKQMINCRETINLELFKAT